MSDREGVALSPELIPLVRAQLDRGGVFRVRAQGLSMWPLVGPGAVVTVVPLPADGPRVGDVVLVDRPDAVVLHRVVARPDAETVVTKGDAVGHADPPLPRALLVGRLPPRPWDAAVAHASRLGGRLLARALARAHRALAHR